MNVSILFLARNKSILVKFNMELLVSFGFNSFLIWIESPRRLFLVSWFIIVLTVSIERVILWLLQGHWIVTVYWLISVSFEHYIVILLNLARLNKSVFSSLFISFCLIIKVKESCVIFHTGFQLIDRLILQLNSFGHFSPRGDRRL